MVSAQYVQKELLLLEEEHADALLVKLRKVLCVLVNANLMNFLMPVEIAIPVEPIKSSQTEFAFAKPDIVSTVVESALFLVDKVNSPSKEDALFALLTPSTKLKSTVAIAQLVTTKTSLEFVKNLC